MPSIFRPQLVLVLVGGVIFFTNLGGPKLWDEDEPRNAACAREMLERGDWVVPTFNYELRPQKPVLLYWLMMASYSVFGVNELAARLPSALLAMGTTLVTFHLGRLLFNARVGLFGGLMMASCLMFGVAGRAATPDSCLIFFTSLSLLAFVWQGSASSGFSLQGSVESGSEESAAYREVWRFSATDVEGGDMGLCADGAGGAGERTCGGGASDRRDRPVFLVGRSRRWRSSGFMACGI